MEIPGTQPVGFQFKAELSSSVDDSYSDCYYDDRRLMMAAQAVLEKILPTRPSVNIFDTFDIDIVEPASSYDSDSQRSNGSVGISEVLVKKVTDQSAEYHEAQANHVKAIEQLLEITDSYDVASQKSRGRRLFGYLRDNQRARGWDSTLSNSNYRESKLSRAEGCFDDLARRKNPHHENYIYGQKRIRDFMSGFGQYHHDAPKSWTTKPSTYPF
ncbi:hypothetical protein N9850_11030 [Granulosicoccus sp.]|nr:hypothetical protein [Granulosicoccus sp.]MDB4224297.1 hypothetical protein [Granulosicoccus sp.]